MNERIEHCLYSAGLTAQGCWDELDDYARQGIEKLVQLIVQECIDKLSGLVVVSGDDAFEKWNLALGHAELEIREHFGFEE